MCEILATMIIQSYIYGCVCACVCIYMHIVTVLGIKSSSFSKLGVAKATYLTFTKIAAERIYWMDLLNLQNNSGKSFLSI